MVQPYYYQDSHCTLYLGDNREVLAGVDTSGVDLLLTDPPYGIGWDTDYAKDFAHPDPHRKKALDLTWTRLRGDAQPFDPTPWLSYPQVILWGANCYSDKLPMGRWLIWDKRFPNGKHFLSSGEGAWMKGGHGVHLYAQTWQGVCRSQLHTSEKPVRSLAPTQKPVALGVWCIQQARKVTLTLDPYAGSGSFLISAKSLGIQSLGIEIEEPYAETAARRLERTDVETQLPLHLTTCAELEE